MQPSPMADTSKLLLPSLRFSIVSPWRWLSQRMNQPFWSAAMRKCSLPAAPAFAHFTEVLARFSENNFFACVQATADLRSTRSQFLSRQREFFLAVPKSVADSRGTAHPSPSFSMQGHRLPSVSRSYRSFGCMENSDSFSKQKASGYLASRSSGKDVRFLSNLRRSSGRPGKTPFAGSKIGYESNGDPPLPERRRRSCFRRIGQELQ